MIKKKRSNSKQQSYRHLKIEKLTFGERKPQVGVPLGADSVFLQLGISAGLWRMVRNSCQ